MPNRCQHSTLAVISACCIAWLCLCLRVVGQEQRTWQVRDAEQQERERRQMEALEPAARERLQKIEKEMEAALASFKSGQAKEALERYRAAMAECDAVLPMPSTRRVKQLLQLADLCEDNLDFTAARDALSRSQEICAALFDGENPLALGALSRQGGLQYLTGQYEQAKTTFSQATDLAGRLYGASDAASLSCRSDLASVWLAQGNAAKAQQVLLDVAERIAQLHGKTHPAYATALDNLAGVDVALGDFTRAIQRLNEALTILRETSGDDEQTLTTLNNLAGVYSRNGQKAEARRLFAEVVARWPHGETAAYATAVSNLSEALRDVNETVEAERLAREALRIHERIFGPQHLTVARSLNNLALLIDSNERRGEAEKLLRRALAIRTDQLGKLHPDYAESLNNLAVHFRQAGQPREAVKWYKQSLEAQEQIIETTAPALAERQQLTLAANLRRTLDGFLSVAPLADVAPAEIYRHVLRWKGQVLARQLARRRATGSAETATLEERLRSVAGQLAAVALSTQTAENAAVRDRKIQSLTEERERLEAKLAELAPADYGALGITPQELSAALPADFVLVDFLEYWRTAQEGAPPRSELAAFVIKRGAEVARVELGTVDSLAGTIESWLRTHGAPGQGEEAGLSLRSSIWAPLESLVGGAKTVLYSPDGCLTRLPLAALPGKGRGSFLIEEKAVVVAAVPQLLPRLLTEASVAPSSPPSLLLVGDIDYGVTPSVVSELAAQRSLKFEKLAAARSELLAVRDSFESAFPNSPPPTVLRGAAATEAAFGRECSTPQFVHVVSHGFSIESAGGQQSVRSSRLCGLVLAGANARNEETGEDGLLTADEVSALNLRSAKMVVLSACETGTGSVAAGEGVLGLQRAFQLAGAQSVVASLWKVDDRATQQMMDLFYERLWKAGGMSRAEALRQAQLAILRGGHQRGIGIVKKTPDEQRVSPYYWGAFVLSGDWR